MDKHSPLEKGFRVLGGLCPCTLSPVAGVRDDQYRVQRQDKHPLSSFHRFGSAGWTLRDPTHPNMAFQGSSQGSQHHLPQLTCRKGMMPSRAMACSRRGAPVRLCRPAPQVEKKEPMTMTQGDGQASMPMTRFPCRASPNLRVSREGCQ